METLGGGWTEVFTFNGGADYRQSYTSPGVMASATEILFAYRHRSDKSVVTHTPGGLAVDYAAIPFISALEDWRTTFILQSRINVAEPVEVTLDGGSGPHKRVGTLRFGAADANKQCWQAGPGSLPDRGRFCIDGTRGPNFADWGYLGASTPSVPKFSSSVHNGQWYDLNSQLHWHLSIAVRAQTEARGCVTDADCDAAAGLRCAPSRRGSLGECVRPSAGASCADLLLADQAGAQSGFFVFHQPGWNHSIELMCDQTTHGGGWTVVHQQPPEGDYIANGWLAPQILADPSQAGEMLIAYRNSSAAYAITVGGWASFPWSPEMDVLRTYHFFTLPLGTGGHIVTVNVTTESTAGDPQPKKFFFGRGGGSAGNYCSEPHSFTTALYGAVCVANTEAPMFSRWAEAGSYPHFPQDPGLVCCKVGGEAGGCECGNGKLFSVAVRPAKGTLDMCSADWECDSNAGQVCNVFTSRCVLPATSCAAILQRALERGDPAPASGHEVILPPGGTTPKLVFCDQATHGGGWSEVYRHGVSAPPGTHAAGDQAAWALPALMANATEAGELLITYRDAAGDVAAGSEWAAVEFAAGLNGMRVTHFMETGVATQYEADVTAVTGTGVVAEAVVAARLRAGAAQWASVASCEDGVWQAGLYGHFCVSNTRAPFLTAFASSDASMECSTSDDESTACCGGRPQCGPTKQFTISVRPPASVFGGCHADSDCHGGLRCNEATRQCATLFHSCAALKTAEPSTATGYAWIKPAGAAGAQRVYCDMHTLGGGWTEVFRHDGSTNIHSDAEDVVWNPARIMASAVDAAEILMTYRDATGRTPAGDEWAVFRLTADLGDYRSEHFAEAAGSQQYTSDVVSVTGTRDNEADGSAAELRTFKGSVNTQSGVECAGYNPGLGPTTGFLCLAGTLAPHLYKFAPDYDTDCRRSDEAYNEAPVKCSPTRYFSWSARPATGFTAAAAVGLAAGATVEELVCPVAEELVDAAQCIPEMSFYFDLHAEPHPLAGNCSGNVIEVALIKILADAGVSQEVVGGAVLDVTVLNSSGSVVFPPPLTVTRPARNATMLEPNNGTWTLRVARSGLRDVAAGATALLTLRSAQTGRLVLSRAHELAVTCPQDGGFRQNVTVNAMLRGLGAADFIGGGRKEAFRSAVAGSLGVPLEAVSSIEAEDAVSTRGGGSNDAVLLRFSTTTAASDNATDAASIAVTLDALHVAGLPAPQQVDAFAAVGRQVGRMLPGDHALCCTAKLAQPRAAAPGLSTSGVRTELKPGATQTVAHAWSETDGADVHYSTDGTVPTSGSAQWPANGGVSVTLPHAGFVHLQLVAVAPGLADSAVTERNFTFT